MSLIFSAEYINEMIDLTYFNPGDMLVKKQLCVCYGIHKSLLSSLEAHERTYSHESSSSEIWFVTIDSNFCW